MDEENKPTVLTVEDIDNFMKNLYEENDKPMKIANCPSCSIELPYILTDYYTGQCQECFYARKSWCSSSPVRDAFWLSQ